MALEKICAQVGVPVIVKEVGCGISTETSRRLSEAGVTAIDVSGAGGTHWGRIETLRYKDDEIGKEIGESFSDWGVSTVESLLNAKEANVSCQIWASGGVRNGVEAMKLLSLGAHFIGMARPWLLAMNDLDRFALRLQRELQIALFCTGCANVDDLKKKKVWKWKNRSQKPLRDSRS